MRGQAREGEYSNLAFPVSVHCVTCQQVYLVFRSYFDIDRQSQLRAPWTIFSNIHVVPCPS
jgi:hypothetical protein